MDAGTFVFVLLSVIGAVSVVVEMINPQYKANPAFYPVLGLVAGLFYKKWGRQKNEE